MPSRSGSGAFPVALRRALVESGALGATARQLATRLASAPGPIEAALDELAVRGEVLRVGRGLWMLRAYEDLVGRDDFEGPGTYEQRFLRENGVRLGRWDGPITFRSNETEPVHRWWPYVQGFSAEFVRGVLVHGGEIRGRTVLDPFAGSGTTVVEARRAGARAIGVEILPPALLAARVKSRFELSPTALVSAARRTIRAAERGPADPAPFLHRTAQQFDPRALRGLLRLRRALPPEGTPVAEAVRVAFGGILIPSSRLHRSPCLGYARGPPAETIAPIARFERRIGEMRDDLRTLGADRARWGPPARLIAQDARSLELPPGSVDLVVTSPPYVNGMDYVMNYKLDLAWLGYAHSYADLAALRRVEVACDNLPRSETAAHLGLAGAPDPWLGTILSRIRDNVRRKGTYRRDDMHAVVRKYFDDLLPVLARLRDALSTGGRLVIVLGDSLLAGTYVPGDLLLARIGARLGLEIEAVDVARRRRSGQRRSFELRESVVTLRRR